MNSGSVKQANFGVTSTASTKFKWEIQVDDLKLKDCITSPELTTFNAFGQNHWRLELYTHNEKGPHEGQLELFLENCNHYDLTVTFEFSLLNNENKVVNRDTEKEKLIEAGENWGFFNFVDKSFIWDVKNKIINHNSGIIICCKISNEKRNNVKMNQTFSTSFNSFDTYSKHLSEKIFANVDCSDITIVANEKKFHVHKLHLATHSSVFRRMFGENIKASHKNILEINDINEKVLYQFLKFFYTGTVNNIEEISCDLLYAAEKYNVIELKELCEKSMSSSINFDNAIMFLRLAQIYNAKWLKNNIIKFIALNLKNFNNKPEFRTLGQKQLLEIINYTVNQNQKVI